MRTYLLFLPLLAVTAACQDTTADGLCRGRDRRGCGGFGRR